MAKTASVKKTTSGVPKRPANSYLMFWKEKSAQFKESAGKNSRKAAAAAWKALSDDEKAVYQARFKAELKRYEEEMEKYQKTSAAGDH